MLLAAMFEGNPRLHGAVSRSGWGMWRHAVTLDRLHETFGGSVALRDALGAAAASQCAVQIGVSVRRYTPRTGSRPSRWPCDHNNLERR